MENTKDSSVVPLLPELLSKIKSPADLRTLDKRQLPQLCQEIREYLISCLSTNPGHFGSSMGAVEIAVALHYVFDTPNDNIVWDVGHQAYAHKLLTGRAEAFRTQRTKDGISGFPLPAESEYDTFVCGHAGNSISAALGMAIADLNTPGKENRKTIAVIGDASISGGLAFEGLNNTSNNPNNLLIILNDNDMSIDANVGALHRYLSNLTTSARYNKIRFKAYTALRKIGLINDRRKGFLLRFSNSIKALVAGRQNIFEGLNIRYFGPFDGNDVGKIIKVLNDIKEMKGPRILHLCTTKGKGFPAAEADPGAWHAPGKFNPETGIKTGAGADNRLLWQQVFGTTLVELAEKNDKIVAVTAAMPSGTSVNMLGKRFPERTFDVGISEGHAVTFAGGMASAGKKPFVAIYSSFLQRAYDNIIHDVAIQGLPVVFCIDRAGLVGEDGVTHHGLFDIPYLRIIPGMTVASPMDAQSLRNLMKTAEMSDSPFSIRYPRGKVPDDSALQLSTPEPLKPGSGRKIFSSENAECAILTIGPVGNDALKAAARLNEEGIATDVYDMIWIKPLDNSIIDRVAKEHRYVVTVEDGVITGGFGDAVAERLNQTGSKITLKKLGVPDRWISHGTVAELHRECGFDADSIAETIRNMIITDKK